MKNKKNVKNKIEGLKDYIIERGKDGFVVINTFDGLKEAKLDDIIKQPTEGLLYDLNRDMVTITTFLDDQKWINDYACMLVIYKLKEYYDKLTQEA